MKKIIIAKWRMIALAIIIVLAIFLRTYHLSDWLFFKSDQVRDAILVSHAYEEGLLSLPLLGPRAGGTMLRLGPAFYYFQYIATLVASGTDPVVFVYPTLIFSIFTVILVFSFSRKFFNSNWALIITFFSAISFAAIEFSRFAWNPNASGFFVLLCIYAFLEIASEKNSIKNKNWWTVIAAISLAIASQLHFSVFFGLPIALIIFLILKRKEVFKIITLKRFVIFASIFLLFYMPVIFSDIINKGDNLHQFFSSIGNKSSDHSLISNVLKDAYYFGKYFLRLLFGYIGSNKPLYYLAWIFIAFSLYAMNYFHKKEGDQGKNNFILMIASLFMAFFILYVPLAYKIDNPRFFLPISIIPFIFVAFIGMYIREKIANKFGMIMAATITCIVVFTNIYYVANWFYELNGSQFGAIDPEKTVVMLGKGHKFWWNGGHFKRIAQFMHDDCKKNKLTYFMPKSTLEYSNAIGYELNNIGENRPIHGLKNINSLLDGCIYYISQNKESLSKVSVEGSDLKDYMTTDLGNVFITRIDKKNSANEVATFADLDKTPVEDIQEKETTDQLSKRLNWRDVLNYLKK